MKYIIKSRFRKSELWDENKRKITTIHQPLWDSRKRSISDADGTVQYRIEKEGNQFRIWDNSKEMFHGKILYPTDSAGRSNETCPIRPPFPKRLLLTGNDIAYHFEQQENHTIEISSKGSPIAVLNRMLSRTHVLETFCEFSPSFSALLFVLGQYLVADDALLCV